MIKKKVIGKVLSIAKSIVFGVADNVPVINSIKANIESEIGGKGKFDYIRLATAIGTLAVLIAFLFGKITFDEVERLLNVL